MRRILRCCWLMTLLSWTTSFTRCDGQMIIENSLCICNYLNLKDNLIVRLIMRPTKQERDSERSLIEGSSISRHSSKIMYPNPSN